MRKDKELCHKRPNEGDHCHARRARPRLDRAAFAQSNDDDYTPLNSRIKRDRQSPTQLFYRFDPSTWTMVQKDRSKEMLSQFSRCIYRRSKEGSLELLEKTDLGFVDFSQIGLAHDRALRIYGFQDCLGRVASRQNSGVQMRFNTGNLRQWMLREAYFDRHPDRPEWVKAGYMIGERTLPLSGENPGVMASLDFADCVVAADPYGADFFFRTVAGSAIESEALNALVPALGPCLPAGVRMQIDPTLLRVWLGEALWHAANNSRPAA